MLQLNLLLPPLLGGFVFASKWFPLRYYTLRTDGYRLVFTAAIAGLFFLTLACIISSICLGFPWGTKISYEWHLIFPPDGSGRSAMAFLLGAVLWAPFNYLGQHWKLLSDGAAVDRAIREKRDPLEMLLREALGLKKLLSVSVENGKVYIGYLKANLNPAFPTESITLLPLFSGHRDSETQKMIIDIDYHADEAGHDKLTTEFKTARKQHPEVTALELLEIVRERIASELPNYEIVLPVSRIQSVNIFDIDIYKRHFRTDSNTQPP